MLNAAYTGQIKVRFADTDANGHTYFGSYMVLADEVVSEYLAQVGWDGGTDGDFLTFTVNANIDFVGECMAMHSPTKSMLAFTVNVRKSPSVPPSQPTCARYSETTSSARTM